MPFVESRPVAGGGGRSDAVHHRHRSGGQRSEFSRPIFHPPVDPFNRDFPSRKRHANYADYAAGFSSGAVDQAPVLKRRRSDDLALDGRNWNAAFGRGEDVFMQQPRRRFVDGSRGGNLFERRIGDADVDVLVSRDEIERCSPSRKDGIDPHVERQLRYSYCSYIHNMGIQLQLPHSTVATAVVLCHRFFFRRSHACHDRYLIATAALFLAGKSEETPCLLNSVLRASCQVSQHLGLAYYPYLLHAQDWFSEYRERVTSAEQMILATLDFELDVNHPYAPLTSGLNKLGLSETSLVGVAWNLISEGLRSSLWLQFKPHHIAAGAAFLAAKFLNYDLAYYPSFWQAFNTTLPTVQDVVQQLMELF